jgi:hypothetical protein
MITRYRLEYDDLDVYDNGNLVKYEDHQAEVAQLQARVAELEAALSRVQKLTEWEAPDADSGAALNFNQGYESALEDVAAALKP